MSEQNIDVWILKELRQLGIPLPKLKKMRIQIQKKNQKGKASGTFGVCLSKLLENDSLNPSSIIIPTFLEKMVVYLSKHLTHNCIFRKNGNRDRMRSLQERLEKGIDLADECVEDAAGVLKCWFRDLPVPLIPEAFHDLFISCHKACESTSSSKALLLACSLLPPEHLATLKYTLEFLASVGNQSAVNKMSSQSLAIVFAPNIMPVMNKRKLEKSVSIEAMKEKQQMAMSVLQWLIEHSEEVKKTPESVEFLAELSMQPSEKTNRTKTKRRKSMCDIVGVKIKKMVAPHSDVIHLIDTKETPVIKHKIQCKSAHPIPAKRTKRQLENTPVKGLCEDIHPEDSKGHGDKILIHVGPSNPHSLDEPKDHIKANSLSPSMTESSIQGMADQIADEECSQEICVQQSDLCHVNYSHDLKTVIAVNESSENKTVKPSLLQQSFVTPSKDDNWKPDRPGSTLKRGRPNSITSGLKDGRKGSLKSFASLENLVTPFEKLHISKRRSRSASSIDKISDDDSVHVTGSPSNFRSTTTSRQQNEDLINVKENSPVSVNRALDFSNMDQERQPYPNDLCNKIEGSFVVSPQNVLAASLGFSPILDESQSSDEGNENTDEGNERWSIQSNASRNPFGDITNASEIPTLNSTVGDNSIFGSCEKLAENREDQNSVGETHYATPSPISNTVCPKSCSKLSITASSTPANEGRKIVWQDAATFGFNRNADENDEGPKRESIIKLKETNAGKVLANIHLYNNKGNTLLFSHSPAPPRNIALERNHFATKSVRERSKPFSESHGFKVPRICPSSMKRVSQRAQLTAGCTVVKQLSLNIPFSERMEKSAQENKGSSPDLAEHKDLNTQLNIRT